MSRPVRLLSLASVVLALPLAFGCQTEPAPGAGEAGAGPGESGPEAAATVGKITKIRGSRGVGSPDLPEGAFLGEGAALHAGQWLELPRGTRVEVELSSGTRLRLDEDSRLRLPEAGHAEQLGAVTLERGRLVVLADAAPLEVLAADDRLVVERGEVEIHHAGETRHFGVVQGRSVLFTAGRDIPLGPGASISTPATPKTRPETPVDENLLAAALIPTLSLAPLQDTAWTSAFDATARLAADVPEGVGSLVARRAGSKVERQSLRLTEQTVNVTISGRIARTEIEQAFHNDSSQTLEGIYQFPLPADASISDLQLLVGDTWMRGEMLEKTRARQIFRQIVDATVPRDPALLQWEQGGVFKLNIFPIPGKGERRIKIAYTQVLPEVGDTLRYRYPMGGSGATATEIGDFAFNVKVDGADLDAEALAGVRTPMAELQRSDVGQGLELSMRERDYQPSHELGVDVPLPLTGAGGGDGARVQAATHRDRDGQGYFMLTLAPDLSALKAKQVSRKPVHYAFVLDRSHGTSAELWTAAEGMTKAMLGTLEPEDRFTILACDTACDRLDGGLRTAGAPDTLAEVDRFLTSQTLAGASDIGNMLTRAGESLGLGREGFVGGGADEIEPVVVYLGDGVPTSGALTPDELGDLTQGQLARLRVQAVALGARSDLLVLDNLVRQSGGDLVRADARDDLHGLARELRLRAQVPVARDLELELPSGLTDVYPKSIPALRPGDTLTLVGKLAEGDASMLRGDVRLHGRHLGARGEAVAVDERFQIMLDAEYSKSGRTAVHAHLPRTWAQHEITHLTQTKGAAASEEIIALSREYNVLSRFTALLVLENDRMYREFNVARQSDKKDAWGGEASADAPAPEAEPSTVTETKSAEEASPLPDAAPANRGDEGEFDGSSFDDFPGGGGFDPLEPASERARGEDFDEDAPFDSLDNEFEEFAEAESSDKNKDSSIGGSSGSSSSASGSGRGKSGGAAKPSESFAPAPPPPKKKEASKSSKPKGASQDPWGGGDDWGRGGGGAWQQEQQQWRPPRPQMILRQATGPSANEEARIAELQQVRDVDLSNRKAHRDLVRRAVRAGHRNALAFAAAWAAADPDHAPALLAHADLLAAAGDPLALRAYASAVEVEAFSTKLHARMAEALTLAGDFERACSHRRALVSIDPTDGASAGAYVECLVAAGRFDEARDALAQASARAGTSSQGKKALASARRALDSGIVDVSQRLHGNADLRAELSWTSNENLDLAVVDRRARRLSVLRPENVRVREEREGARRVETLTLREVQGTVFVEVTRPETRDEDPVRATLTVKTATGRQTFALSLEPGTKRVALVRWN